MLSQAHLALGHADEAEALAREATTLEPAVGRTWYTLAEVLKTSVEPQVRDEAAVAYRRALELDSQLVTAHHELGALYFKQGDYPEATREFEAIITAMPLHKQSYPMLAQCYARLGRKAEAQTTLKEYERLDEMDLSTAPLEYSLWATPERTDLRLKLARLYLKYERPDLATGQVSLILERDPNNPEARELDQAIRAAQQ